MASSFAQKPPAWLYIVGIILLLWGLAGCWAFYMHVTLGAAANPQATDWDRAYFAALPSWFTIDFAIAVGAGVLGSIALLLRSKWAVTLYWLSLIAVIIQFGYMFLATDVIAVKGVSSTFFPAFIFVMALFQVWFSSMVKRRGWLR
ncbi:hypothetical protein [Sphingomonas sp. MS122]|uniref:hypothetical protein n=1 Tax=Sphingomonas sp. MS122 TaxID=3412683 RepID=UPI003C30443F